MFMNISAASLMKIVWCSNRGSNCAGFMRAANFCETRMVSVCCELILFLLKAIKQHRKLIRALTACFASTLEIVKSSSKVSHHLQKTNRKMFYYFTRAESFTNVLTKKARREATLQPKLFPSSELIRCKGRCCTVHIHRG